MFKKASDYKNDKLSIVIFGPPNAGKTTLAKTVKGNVCVVDAERGLQSINDRDDIDVFQLFENTEGLEVPRTERFPRLVKFIEHLKAGKIEKKFDWVFVDSITEVSQNLIEQLKVEDEKRMASGEAPNKFWIWGEYNERITKLLKDLRDVKGFNVVLNALVDTSKNEDGSKDVSVDLQGKISDRLPAIFDEVFYLYRPEGKDDKKRILVTDKFKNILCKDRSGKLQKFEEPNLQAVADKIKGVKNEK